MMRRVSCLLQIAIANFVTASFCYAYVTPHRDNRQLFSSHAAIVVPNGPLHLHRCGRCHTGRRCFSAWSRSDSHAFVSTNLFAGLEVESSTTADLDLPVDLTLILPAFNEELRIEDTITKYATYLKSEMAFNCRRCSILVVDDGSDDDTCNVVRRCAESLQNSNNNDIGGRVEIKSISLDENGGKGAAVSNGLIATQSEALTRRNDRNKQSGENVHVDDQICQIVLVADADGSGDIGYLNQMLVQFTSLLSDMVDGGEENSYTTNANDGCGNRGTKAMLIGNRDGSTSKSRIITRWGFRTVVKIICGDLQVDDTQCGFKLMTLDAGILLYSNLNLRRWTHDVEVLYRAKELGIPVTEMKIGWEDKEGSKLATTLWETVIVSAVMLMEVLFMRINYATGRWSVPAGKSQY